MQIQVHTDNAVEGSNGLRTHVESVVADTIERFSDQLTRIDAYLRDTNGPKSAANDKTCLLEARLAGRPPLVVSHEAESHHQAIDGAAEKLERSLDNLLGKLSDRKGRRPLGGGETEV
jgi:ribosomal subunit interface protein